MEKNASGVDPNKNIIKVVVADKSRVGPFCATYVNVINNLI